jgi:hypothetical protein
MLFKPAILSLANGDLDGAWVGGVSVAVPPPRVIVQPAIVPPARPVVIQPLILPPAPRPTFADLVKIARDGPAAAPLPIPALPPKVTPKNLEQQRLRDRFGRSYGTALMYETLERERQAALQRNFRVGVPLPRRPPVDDVPQPAAPVPVPTPAAGAPPAPVPTPTPAPVPLPAPAASAPVPVPPAARSPAAAGAPPAPVPTPTPAPVPLPAPAASAPVPVPPAARSPAAIAIAVAAAGAVLLIGAVIWAAARPRSRR